jgi:hypothetical protein
MSDEFAYVTKYALSKGGVRKIRFVRQQPGSVLIRNADIPSGEHYVLGIEAFENKDEALKDCEYRRNRKLKVLESQQRNLRKIRFEVVE